MVVINNKLKLKQRLFLERNGRETSNSSEESDECESGRETRHNYVTDTEMSTVTEHYFRGHTLTKTSVPFQHYGSFYLRMGAVGECHASAQTLNI